MPQQSAASPHHSTKTVSLLDILKPEWAVSQQSIHTHSLIVRHDIHPPDEVVCSPLKEHLIVSSFSNEVNQVARIGDLSHEGFVPQGKFFLHPSTYPGFYSWKSTHEGIVFVLEPDFLARIAAQTECLNPDLIELRPILLGQDAQIEHIARSFFFEMKNDALGGRLYSESLAIQFVICLLRKHCTFLPQLKQYKGGLSRQQLKAVIEYINTYLESNISLKELTQVSAISSHYHFCRLFKQSTGIAPYQYVIQQRIEKSKRLLRQKHLPIIEIALMCGFSNQSHFNRTFRSRVGVTPRTCIRQVY